MCYAIRWTATETCGETLLWVERDDGALWMFETLASAREAAARYAVWADGLPGRHTFEVEAVHVEVRHAA